MTRPTQTNPSWRVCSVWAMVAGLGVFLEAAAVATCVAPAPARGMHANYGIVDREGVTRTYDLYVPASYDAVSGRGGKPLPLVVDLHGLNATKANQEAISGYQAKADSVGFLVVYPSGKDKSWNAYNCCGEAHANGYDDVGFVRDLVADVSSKVNVDHQRIYITGISNGGSMTHRLACEAADLFAAAATFSFDLALPDEALGVTSCSPARPIAMAVFRGYRDGGITAYCPGIFGATYPGAQAGLVDWAAIDGCVGSPTESVWSPSGTQVACFPGSINNVTQTYRACAAGVQVQLTSWDAGHDIYPRVNGAVAWDEALAPFALPGLPDADDDGIADVDDNCPGTSNADQLDADGDCRGDACPTAPSPTSTPTPVAMPFATPTSTSLVPTPVACLGDCDADRTVTSDDLLTLVRVALGEVDASACGAGDSDHDEDITVAEIVAAVGSPCAAHLAPTSE